MFAGNICIPGYAQLCRNSGVDDGPYITCYKHLLSYFLGEPTLNVGAQAVSWGAVPK
jgi:hypothetical protein